MGQSAENTAVAAIDIAHEGTELSERIPQQTARSELGNTTGHILTVSHVSLGTGDVWVLTESSAGIHRGILRALAGHEDLESSVDLGLAPAKLRSPQLRGDLLGRHVTPPHLLVSLGVSPPERYFAVGGTLYPGLAQQLRMRRTFTRDEVVNTTVLAGCE